MEKYCGKRRQKDRARPMSKTNSRKFGGQRQSDTQDSFAKKRSERSTERRVRKRRKKRKKLCGIKCKEAASQRDGSILRGALVVAMVIWLPWWASGCDVTRWYWLSFISLNSLASDKKEIERENSMISHFPIKYCKYCFVRIVTQGHCQPICSTTFTAPPPYNN